MQHEIRSFFLADNELLPSPSRARKVEFGLITCRRFCSLTVKVSSKGPDTLHVFGLPALLGSLFFLRPLQGSLFEQGAWLASSSLEPKPQGSRKLRCSSKPGHACSSSSDGRWDWSTCRRSLPSSASLVGSGDMSRRAVESFGWPVSPATLYKPASLGPRSPQNCTLPIQSSAFCAISFVDMQDDRLRLSEVPS